MPRRAAALRLSADEVQRLAKLALAPSTPQALAFRARLVLCCGADDRPTNAQVAQQFGCDPDTVCKWRGRFAHHRFDGLRDLPRSGRPRTFSPQDRHKVLVLATTKPAELGLPQSHWSLEDLALHILKEAHYTDMSRSTVQRILSEADLKPHRCRYWLHSDDPDFEAKALALCRLYLDAPALYRKGELVLCVDEKTSIQARQRKYPTLPPKPGLVERVEFEYIRHGTRCLLGTLVVATGQVLGTVTARRAEVDFCGHIRQVAGKFPEAKRVHWVMDNLNTHWSLGLCRLLARLSGVKFQPRRLKTGQQRRAFLTDPSHKHVVVYTPKHGSWLNQVELFFGVLSRRVLRRGEFRWQQELAGRILAYIAWYNEHRAKPYRWTYTGKPLVA